MAKRNSRQEHVGFQMNVKCTETDLKNTSIDPQDSTTCFKTVKSSEMGSSRSQKRIFQVHQNGIRRARAEQIETRSRDRSCWHMHSKVSEEITPVFERRDSVYRMMPKVTILRYHRKDAEELKEKCPGVFDIEDMGNGRKRAVVVNARNCTMSRECIRDTRWKR